MNRKTVTYIICGIALLLLLPFAYYNAARSSEQTQQDKPTATPPGIATPVPGEIIPPTPTTVKDITDLAPELPETKKFFVLLHDGKGGYKAIVIPPDRIDEELKKIDETLIVAISRPRVDDAYYAELDKIEQEQSKKIGQFPPDAPSAGLPPAMGTPTSSTLPATEQKSN